ncbi:phospho-acceptor domain-containing protein [Flavobacteriaceae bacterium MAR_2010_105]|nr:phospho-acceptor domain-containing protein [Flavobacteriaceae bacterium MAR_2010_105]
MSFFLKAMTNSEQELKERIKELTCLYEVSSIIVNADFEQLEHTFRAIAFSLKKAFQFPENTNILIETQTATSKTGELSNRSSSISTSILIFNKPKGKITAFLNEMNSDSQSFLNEEQLLIDNVAIKIGSFLERIEIQNNERSLIRQMEHADRLSILGELTAGIAHELNTPLANILGFAELLKSRLEQDNQALADLNKIINNAIFSREVVKKLMFFACEMPQVMKPVNIVTIIKESIKLLEPTFRKNEIKYLVKIEDETLMLRADPVQITQIIFNLLMNAIYFSPKNGLVTLEAIQNEKSIILKLRDEGEGLSEAALQKVFQPFYTTKPVGEGSGLGLSVVHGIVASHKGTITVKNHSKKGAIFEVQLPK